LACDAGGGRGHVTTLAAVARAMGPEVALVAALSNFSHAGELRGLCQALVRAPDTRRSREVPPGQLLPGGASWATALVRMGLSDESRARRSLAFWRKTIVDHDISVLVADAAPLALLAARGLRDEGWAIRTVSIGTGYFTPPASLPRFPALHADLPVAPEDEEAVLGAINRAAGADDIAPLPRLPALYLADLTLVTTLPALDPYLADRPEDDLIAPLVPASASLAGAGDEVFVYFSTDELRDPELLAALEALPLPRRGFLPATPPEVIARLRASGMVILDRPTSADDIAARSRLILHAAPHGTLCLAALAGLPQFAVPHHLEQLFNAQRAAALGILHHALPGSPDIGTQISAAYADRALATTARDLALALRPSHPADPIAELARRLAPELAAARSALQ
jgi:hypothetical protein